MPIIINPVTAGLIMVLASKVHQQDATGQQTAPVEAPQQTNPNTFNPQISLITDFRANVVNSNRTEKKEVDLHEAELGLAADVDPFLRAEAYIAFSKENGDAVAEVEEGFGRYTRLGKGLSAKFGKIAGAIGRIQRNHGDQLAWLDYPFVVQDFLGSEGMRSGGGSLSYLLPGDKFNEFTVEGLVPEDGNLFKNSHGGNLAWIGHYRTFFDFSEDTSAQLGATYVNGPGGGNTRAQMYGVDFVYKWQPGAKKSLVLESEAFWGKPGGSGSKTAFGGFAAATYQFMPQFFATAKLDYSEIPGTTDLHRAVSFGLTFKPTEFHFWRVEFQHTTSNFAANKNTLNLQFQMVIGSHPAHKY